jgi:hypothetical protein
MQENPHPPYNASEQKLAEQDCEGALIHEFLDTTLVCTQENVTGFHEGGVLTMGDVAILAQNIQAFAATELIPLTDIAQIDTAIICSVIFDDGCRVYHSILLRIGLLFSDRSNSDLVYYAIWYLFFMLFRIVLSFLHGTVRDLDFGNQSSTICIRRQLGRRPWSRCITRVRLHCSHIRGIIRVLGRDI